MSIKIHHNPRCSKSRQTLELLQQNGTAPTVVDYLNHPPSTAELKQLLAMLNMTPRDLMRKNEKEYKDNNLDDTSLSDEQLIDAMHRIPKLIERPIVIKDGRAVIGRPPEKVLELL
ncbi:MAG: arsenate reductase (glutaredoxin) [Gammaproteobacteria bacterium]|nr:arsenate reductase (glutaredoxin) [Gammaproteobacteria bacterium]MDH5803313.1 arsenate reductase (glutaredoxin) [Gammaproteobacteria bacterium]